MRSLLLLACSFCFFVQSYAQYDRLMTDEELFDAMNLENPELSDVKESILKNDYIQAKIKLVSYLKSRRSPKWYIDWRDFYSLSSRNPKVWTGDADRYANNELFACGTWYKFGDEIEWTYNPTLNKYDEWTWQMNRLYSWSVLGRAYWQTGEERYAKAFVQQLNSWIDQCEMPTSLYNGAGSVWRTIDSGIRVQGNWPNAFYSFLASPSFDDESIIKMVKSFYQHAVHLRNHNTSNNWLAVEMVGLYTVGALFPEFSEAEDWRNYAVGRLYEEEKKQFYPDGAQVELAPSYHALSLSSIVGVYKLARLNGYKIPLEYVSRLEAAYEYYIKMMMPDGKLPALNDSKWLNCRKYIEEAVELFPYRSDFKYIATFGKEGTPPLYTSVWMPWAGWYVMRSGWGEDDFYSLFEVGPYGVAHQHEDKLSFILYAYGQRLITECGIYAYDTSDMRKYSMSARAHNVVRVDGQDQNRNALRGNEDIIYNQQPQANTWITNNTFDYGEGLYTEGFGAKLDKTVTHKRSLKFVKDGGYWILTDTFIPSDTQFHTYDTWFHFNTSKYVIDKKFGIVYTTATDSTNIAIVRLSGNLVPDVIVGKKSSEIQGWKAVEGGENGYHCIPVATPIYHFSGEGVCKGTYVLIPYKAKEKMPISKIQRLGKDKYAIYLSEGVRYLINVAD